MSISTYNLYLSGKSSPSHADKSFIDEIIIVNAKSCAQIQFNFWQFCGFVVSHNLQMNSENYNKIEC